MPEEGQQEPEADKAGDGQQKFSQDADTGFPVNTRVEEMTAPQQAAFYKDKANRYQSTLKGFGKATPDEIKELREKYDALVGSGDTDQKRAVDEARQQTRADVLRETAPERVELAFAAAAAGRLTTEQVSSLVEYFDLTKFVNDDGKVDRSKVEAAVAKVITEPVRGKRPDLGQGSRPNVSQSGREAGSAEAQKRFGSRARSATQAS